ncbi:MAG: oxygen-independent coproporphyrinogen III oxidase [Terricaulis sp.]
MDPRLLAYAERQAPRYTSYPTAPHFTPAVGAGEYRHWLTELPRDATLSLYLHVPYCKQLCWYCGCNTYAARRDEPVADYVETVLREIELVAAAAGSKRTISIHWGGGTPNILDPEQFLRIFGALKQHFDLSAVSHHAIELDPRHVDAAKARAYAEAGVNRVSLGVQDLNARVQNAIGRVQPLEVVQNAVAVLREAGVAQISMDLMYGLPHQTTEHLRHTIWLANAMRPDRIALFGYAHVPWFKKRQRLIPEGALPDAAERFRQAESARTELESLGYVGIGLDHFALPGDEMALAMQDGKLRRSFQGYVTEEAEVLVGIGPSAISTLPQGYAQNTAEPGAWGRAINAGELATARGHCMHDDDATRRQLIERLMCDFEADLAPLGGAGACSAELSALAPMFGDGLVWLNNDRLTINPAATSLCRLVAMAFDTYAQRGVARHSRAV